MGRLKVNETQMFGSSKINWFFWYISWYQYIYLKFRLILSRVTSYLELVTINCLKKNWKDFKYCFDIPWKSLWKKSIKTERKKFENFSHKIISSKKSTVILNQKWAEIKSNSFPSVRLPLIAINKQVKPKKNKYYNKLQLKTSRRAIWPSESTDLSALVM